METMKFFTVTLFEDTGDHARLESKVNLAIQLMQSKAYFVSFESESNGYVVLTYGTQANQLSPMLDYLCDNGIDGVIVSPVTK